MRLLSILLIGTSASISAPVYAQRTNENVVTQSGDAFGRSVGNERVGLYSIDDVRGFSPIVAGNARIEGLYFDQQDLIPVRLISGNTIRVGISAQRYLFPAPTGIVDYTLVLPGDEAAASLQIERGAYGGFQAAADIEVPITDKLGISFGAGGRRQVRTDGVTNQLRNFGSALQWRPYEGASVIAFGGGYNSTDDEARPLIFPAGTELPPRVPSGIDLGQSWTARDNKSRYYGLIGKLPLGDFRLDAGLFQTSRRSGNAFADILTGVKSDGNASERFVIADRNNLDQSLSGEVRLSRRWQSGDLNHLVALSVRGRDKEREFGGTQRISLGSSSVIRPDYRPRPTISVGEENRDNVEQLTYGAAYGLEWRGRGSLDVSLSRSRYRQNIDFASPARPDVAVSDNPWLFTTTGSVIVNRQIAFYGGYVRGLEEAPIAPDIATNRNEAPPATRTRQFDFGVRLSLAENVNLIGGFFSVKKPYFNLDGARRFRELGDVDNRGFEVSLAGSPFPGLSLLAGSTFLDAKISGEAVENGLIGNRPVGSFKRRSILNVDWRPKAGTSPWSVDFGIESFAARVGNAANTLLIAPRETVNVGARYRFQIGSYKGLLRGQVTNLLNDYSWLVSTSGGIAPTNSRTYTLQLVTDI